VTSRERLVLKLGPDQTLKGKGTLTFETDEGSVTIKGLTLKFAQRCDPLSGHASGDIVLAGSAKFKRRKAGK